ncbi:MAG: methylated-DNA--[protein]-cysteine S-methyltransferase [Deltaproteobacteria bacterium]
MTTIFYHVVPSPIGDLMLVSNGEALTGLYMSDHRGGPKPEDGWRPDEGEFDAVSIQLAAYFAGDLREFDVPLAPHGAEFQKKVWRELCRIPFGKTISYGELARRIGQPTASRAVGLANGRNPISIIVPCHRVIGADGTLTGYGGGIDRKKWLLEHEGSAMRPLTVLPSGSIGR